VGKIFDLIINQKSQILPTPFDFYVHDTGPNRGQYLALSKS